MYDHEIRALATDIVCLYLDEGIDYEVVYTDVRCEDIDDDDLLGAIHDQAIIIVDGLAKLLRARTTQLGGGA
jgi:hypothetical protein